MRISIYITNGVINRAVTIASVLAMFANPALAGDWLVFRNGDTRTNEYWSGPYPPIAGQNVPANSAVKLWTIVDGDKAASNYRLSNDALIHDPPAPEQSAPNPNAPDVNGFIAAIFNAEIWDQVEQLRPLRPQLCSMKSSIQENLYTPGVIHKSWQDMKLAPLPEPIIQLVEALAVQFHIPLCPEGEPQ